MVDRRRSRARAGLYAGPAYLALLERVAMNVRRLREGLQITQEEAAARAAMGLRLWQAIEAATSNVTMLTLARVCAGLDADCVDIFARATNPSSLPKAGRGRPRRRANP